MAETGEEKKEPVEVKLIEVDAGLADLHAEKVKDVGPASEVKAPSVTTPEEDRTTASQREVNLIWETTQMKIALSVIWVSLIVAGGLAIFGKWLGSTDLQLAAVVFVFGVANLVTGFYFGRTNHTKVGGIGSKETKER